MGRGPVRAGMRLRSAATCTEVIVVRCDAEDVTIECAGAPMSADEAGPSTPEATTEATNDESAVKVGKRYADDDVEVLCTRAGAGPLSVAGRPLEMKAPKLLPSSD